MTITAAHDSATSAEELVALEQCFDSLTGSDAFGLGALEQAVEATDAARVAELLKAGVEPNETDSLTATPIWLMAFKANKFAIAELFAKAGADVDHIEQRREPLLLRLVSQSADLEPIRQALKIGASVPAQDRFGWTALHAACTYGHTKVVQTLLAAGADPAATTKDGKRPINFATVNGHHSIAKLLRTEPPRRER